MDNQPERGDAAYYAVEGELDIASSPQIWQDLRELSQAGNHPVIVVDLRQLTFIDSAGIAVLVQLAKHLELQGRTASIVVSPQSQPERVLKLGNFDSLLNLKTDWE